MWLSISLLVLSFMVAASESGTQPLAVVLALLSLVNSIAIAAREATGHE